MSLVPIVATRPACDAYDRALKASAQLAGLRRSELRFHRGRRPCRSNAHVRRLALYLANVAFGIPVRELGRVAGVDHRAVGRALNLIEDLRDDPAVDARIEQLEQELVA